jgi:hypothetical protein
MVLEPHWVSFSMDIMERRLCRLPQDAEAILMVMIIL